METIDKIILAASLLFVSLPFLTIIGAAAFWVYFPDRKPQTRKRRH